MPRALSTWLKRCLLVLVASAVMGGLSAQAQAQYNRPTMNWYHRHTMYMSRCNMRADMDGRYGRVRRYDTWCMTNRRFSRAMPDRPWQSLYPWDRGRISDRGY